MVPERKPRQSCEGHVPLQPALTGPLRSHKMGFLDRYIAPTQECLMAWRAHQTVTCSQLHGEAQTLHIQVSATL